MKSSDLTIDCPIERLKNEVAVIDGYVQREKMLRKRIFHLECALLRIGSWPIFWRFKDIKKYAMEQLRSEYSDNAK